MFLLFSALSLGFLHGLGGDHLMAIAALSVDGAASDSAAVRRARAVGTAMRFAVGHALLLAMGAGLILLIGWTIPPHVERGGELLGGALLIVMGLVTLQHFFRHGSRTSHLAPRTSRLAPRTSHLAPLTSDLAPRTSHLAPRTSHSHVRAMIGAAFAISSLRALAMLTPFGHDVQSEPLALLLALIGVFAAGILASMSLFGVVLAGVLSTRALQRVGHGAGALVGLVSILLGIAWVAAA